METKIPDTVYVFHFHLDKGTDINILKEELINDTKILFFADATYIACQHQLINALVQSHVAFETKTNFAKVPGIEILLRLAGTSQIHKARKLFEITEETDYVVIASEVQMERWKSYNCNPGLPHDENLVPYIQLLDKEITNCKEILSMSVMTNF